VKKITSSIIFCVLPAMAASHGGASAPAPAARSAVAPAGRVGNAGVRASSNTGIGRSVGFRFDGSGGSKTATPRSATSSQSSSVNVQKTTTITNTYVTNYRAGGCCGWGWVAPVWYGGPYYYGYGYYPGFVYEPGVPYVVCIGPTPIYFWTIFHREKEPGIELDESSIHDSVDRRDAEDSVVWFSRDGGKTWTQIDDVRRVLHHVQKEDPGEYLVRVDLPNGPLVIPVEVRDHEVSHVSVTSNRVPNAVQVPVQQSAATQSGQRAAEPRIDQ
jgi:hypothetical protein